MHFTLALAVDQSESSACSESYQWLSAEENQDGPRFSREKRAGENIHTQVTWTLAQMSITWRIICNAQIHGISATLLPAEPVYLPIRMI